MNLVQRVISSVVLVVVLAAILWCLPKWYFGMVISIISAVCLYEYLIMLRYRGTTVNRSFGVVMGFLIPAVVQFQEGSTNSGEVLFIVLACFMLFVIFFLRNDSIVALEGLSLTFFGMMYIAWFLSHVIKINFLEHGPLWITYLISVTKTNDVAAYFIGSRWGKKSLLPSVSPKKSVEGTVAGIVAGGVVSLLFGIWLPVSFGWVHLILLGVVIAVIGQCGDLSESIIKRYCSKKDSGETIPGFGGILDVVDSVLFTVPLFYFYLKAVL